MSTISVETWPSGRRRLTRNQLSGLPFPDFESLRFRQILIYSVIARLFAFDFSSILNKTVCQKGGEFLMSLTELQIKKATPREKRYTLSDTRNLLLEIHPNGNKFWVLRIFLNNKEYRRHIGKFPELSLKQARIIAASEHFAEIDDDEKPQNLFGTIAEEWFTLRMKGKNPQYLKAIRLRLNKYILPKFANMPIDEITAGTILKFCTKIELTGKFETAARCKNVISQILSYAVMTDRAEFNPVFNLRGALSAHTHKHMAAIFEPSEIAVLMHAMTNYPFKIMRCAMLFSIYTAARPGEIRHAEWSEIKNDVWDIPAEKMKMKRRHVVPLSRQVKDILAELRPLTGSGRYLFPTPRDKNRPMSENGVRVALRSLGFSKEQITPHGFRAMFSTIANEHEFNRDVIERQLAHVPDNQISGAYNHAEYMPQRIKLMQWWSDWLDNLL